MSSDPRASRRALPSARALTSVALAVLVAGAGAGACVRSSGFEDDEPGANSYRIDGARKAFTLVTAERRGDGFDFADGRTLRVSGVRGSGEEGFFVFLPASAADDELGGALVPNGVVSAQLITGEADDQFYVPVAGTFAVSGGAAIGDTVRVALRDAVFRHVCRDDELRVDDLDITAAVTAADLSEGLGFSGHAILDTREDGAAVPRVLNAVLPFEDDGALLVIASGLGCLDDPARQLVLDVPAGAALDGSYVLGAGPVRLFASLVDAATSTIVQAPAVEGTLAFTPRDDDTIDVQLTGVRAAFPDGAALGEVEVEGRMVIERGHPADLLGGCQGVTTLGQCVNNTAEFCSSADTLVRIDCTPRGATCATISQEYGVDCLLPAGGACVEDGGTRGVCPIDTSCVVTGDADGGGADGACTADPGSRCRRDEVGACVGERLLADCTGVIAQDLPQGIPLYFDCAALGATCSEDVGCVVASGDACAAPAVCAGGGACPAAGVCP